MVQLLLNHGARIDLHARSLSLPLEAAISQGDDAVLEMLRRAEEVKIAAAASSGRIHDGETIRGSKRSFAGSEVNTGSVA